MPPTIHEPPKAPISSRMMMPPLTPPILSARAFSKSAQVVTFLDRPMLKQTAVATISEICEAPASVSSPKTDTTTEMSATSITSGTHDSQRGGRRFTLTLLPFHLFTFSPFQLYYATLFSFLIIEKMKIAASRQIAISVPQTMVRSIPHM